MTRRPTFPSPCEQQSPGNNDAKNEVFERRPQVFKKHKNGKINDSACVVDVVCWLVLSLPAALEIMVQVNKDSAVIVLLIIVVIHTYANLQPTLFIQVWVSCKLVKTQLCLPQIAHEASPQTPKNLTMTQEIPQFASIHYISLPWPQSLHRFLYKWIQQPCITCNKYLQPCLLDAPSCLALFLHHLPR